MYFKISYLRVLVASLLFAAPAMAQGNGFTAGVGLGVGHQVFSPDDRSSESENGLGGPTLKIGGFVQPNLAILFKATGTFTFPDSGVSGVDQTISHYLVGPAVQFWPTQAVFLEGGVGYSRIAITIEGGGEKFELTDTGVGLMGAVGYMFWQQDGHALGVSLDLAGGSHDGGNAYSASVLFNWQVL